MRKFRTSCSLFIRSTLRFLVLLGLASGIGRLGGSCSVEQPDNEAAFSALLNKSLVSGVTAVANAAEPDQEEAAPPAQSGTVDETSAKCLECHGTFEDLTAKPGNFVATNMEGEIKINPHRYVPHTSKDIPECTNCHEEHPVPPESTVPRPDNVSWCYAACHHQENFTVCTTCHE